MLILGLDPGLETTGYGFIEGQGGRFRFVEAGTIKGQRNLPFEQRLLKLHGGLSELLMEYSPVAVAIEKLYAHYRHPLTAILMGHARGVLTLAAAESRIPVFEYASTMVKKSLTGYGRASKGQVQAMVVRQLGLPRAPEPEDVTDALAVAMTHLLHIGTS